MPLPGSRPRSRVKVDQSFRLSSRALQLVVCLLRLVLLPICPPLRELQRCFFIRPLILILMGAFRSRPSPQPTRRGPLILAAPACEWLGDGAKAIVLRGEAFEISKGGVRGRGHPIGVGLAAAALALIWEGPDSRLVLRSAADPDLALEVHYRAFVAGAGLSLWAPARRRTKPCYFSFDPVSRTLSPAGYEGRLVVGIHLDGESLRLVPPSDPLALVVAPEGGGGLSSRPDAGALRVPAPLGAVAVPLNGGGAVPVSLAQETPGSWGPGGAIAAVASTSTQAPQPAKFGAGAEDSEDPS